MRGVTHMPTLQQHNERISIHTPHEGSDNGVSPTQVKTEISIHTPHEGSDYTLQNLSCFFQGFQSTLPMRGVTDTVTREVINAGKFQSTLPMRGVTKLHQYYYPLCDISIHTPHEGSDNFCGVMYAPCLHFNPHSP